MADNPNLKAQIDALVPEVISKEVEFMSMESGFRQFRNFVVYKEDLTRNPGDTLSIPKVSDLPEAQDLSETSVLRGSGSRLAIGSVLVTPTEKGDEVQYTEYSARVSQSDLQNVIVELLSRQSAKKENLDLRDTFFAGTQTRYADGVAGQSSVAKTLATVDIDSVVEELEANEAMKYVSGGMEHFVGFIHPYAKTALVTALRAVSDYAKSVPNLYAGEIGMYNRVRFIESSYCPFRSFIKTAMAVADANTALVGADDAARLSISDQYCTPETWTLTYTHVGTKWAVTGSVSGAHKVVVAGVEKTTFTTAELAAGDIIVVGPGADLVRRIASSPFTIKTGAVTGTANGSVTFTTQRNVCTKIVAPRHVALGVIKPVTMLGAEAFDYGRVIGVAWNAFYDSIILNEEYGWTIETKR